MLAHSPRRHIRHYELPGAAVHVTWRLKHEQDPLTPDERSIALDVIRRGSEFGCTFNAAVIRDDHVHVLFHPGDQRSSTGFVGSWKSNSSRLICREGGRFAPLWQRDFYQRWIRHPGHLDICTSYILANPARKWPGTRDYPWVIPPG